MTGVGGGGGYRGKQNDEIDLHIEHGMYTLIMRHYIVTKRYTEHKLEVDKKAGFCVHTRKS